MGLCSPAYSATEGSENKKSNEHLISLRDYDFVGEDQRLSALLAERLAVLQAPLNLSVPEAGGPAPWSDTPEPRAPGPFQPKPDYLASHVKLPQVVNVSMDYAELINASDWFQEVNASLLPLIPGFGEVPALKYGGAPAPGYGRAPASGTGRAPAPGKGRAPDPGKGRAPDPNHDARLGQIDARRALKPYRDPSRLDYNRKILDMMKQCIYNAQRKILELDPLVQQYERDPRFRMAFIYSRLDEWLHDMRTILFALMKYRYYRRRAKRVIWYYEHMLRLDIDITYSIEHLMFLHTAYTKNLDSIIPLSKRLELREMKKQQRKAKKMRELGITKSGHQDLDMFKALGGNRKLPH